MATRLLRILHLRHQALSLWKGTTVSVWTGYVNRTLLLRRLPSSTVSVVNSQHTDVESGVTVVTTEGSEATDLETQRFTLETRLRNAQSPEDVWKEVNEEGMTGDNAVLAIAKLHGFTQTMKEEGVTNDVILQDPNFLVLCNVANNSVAKLFTGSVLTMLRNLLLIGMNPESKIIKSLETEIRWRMRRLNMYHLCFLAQFPMHGDSTTESQKELMSEVLRNLDMRWTELREPRSVVQLMVSVGHLSTGLMEKLEDKVLEMAEQLSQEETARVLQVLANRGRRTVPLLRALAYHLSRRQFRLDIDVATTVAYAFANLNFPNTAVLQKMSAELVEQVPQLKPPTLISFAKSYSYLKWHHQPLMDTMATYVITNLKFLSEEQVANFLLAFGRLNFTPSSADEFFDQVLPYVTEGLSSLPKWMQLDLVWSLAILGRLTPTLVAKVLTPSFYMALTGLSFKAQSALLKILHIHTTVQQELTSYSGPLLTAEFCHPSKIHVSPGKNNKAALPVVDTVATVVGGLHKLRSEVVTPYGWTIDCEFVLDKDNRGLTVHEYQADHIPGDQSELIALQDGSHRFAVLVWEYGNYCHQSKKLLGRFAMCRRHLQAANFTLLEVPFYEWKELKSEFQRVEYIKDKIRKAIAEEAVNVL
ncbi:FAST kinase domain-containing protein 4-like isoform X2 [Branchiostoma lanceolatum]|uniref:FAST kinase domain-containing protein 4-like isoform X2 n=1 Tax=Branchiostoma lanceolatum TaxID=7740 RepID=UPI00345720E2